MASTYKSLNEVSLENFQGLVKALVSLLKMEDSKSYWMSERVRGSPSARFIGTTLRGVGLCLLDDIRAGGGTQLITCHENKSTLPSIPSSLQDQSTARVTNECKETINILQ